MDSIERGALLEAIGEIMPRAGTGVYGEDAGTIDDSGNYGEDCWRTAAEMAVTADIASFGGAGLTAVTMDQAMCPEG